MARMPCVRALGMLLVPALACASCGAGADRVGPNVLLIVVDTLRRDHLGCYGYERDVSPHIDRLAADSVRYENAYSQAPWTTPSIGALLSSQYPSTLGIRNERSVLSQDLVLLPELLQEYGWSTGAVVSHGFCSSKWGFDQGFDFFDETNVLGHAGVSSAGVTRAALRFIDAHAGDPFFLWLHYFDPHNEYLSHPGHGYQRERPYRGPVNPRNNFYKLRRILDRLGPPDWDELRRLYDSEIAFTDHHIGRVLERLRSLELYEDSLVILTADHGEEFGDHGRLGHAHSLYQELVHVPLLVKYPGSEPLVAEDPVALVDLYPTLLEFLGLPLPEGLVGRSLFPPGVR